MPHDPRASTASAKWRAIALLALCEVLVMALWFSATAIVPALTAEFSLSGQEVSLISSSVAVGFVAGTLISALLGLADRFDPRRLFTVSALVAAAANGAILAVEPTSALVPGLRFAVGACMAGIYPVGVKMVATWARGDMGLLTGLLVGAITLGTASPHLIDALGGLDWRFTLTASSLLAVAGGLLVNAVRLGPNLRRIASFNPRLVLSIWRNKALRLANLGYFGHMWELYAMWAWMGVFLNASFALNPGGADAPLLAKLLTFATIAVGGLGCFLGGVLADRLGRTTLTMGAMALSGTCALVAGLFFGANPWALAALCLVWGVTVVADSAQFTASVMELSEPDLIGTMVTAQTCAGFLLASLTIHLLPPLVAWFGWEYAFAALAIGPYLGVWAMASLRRHPDAVKLASGNR